MSKKKEKEWKQRLTAAMNAEAEEIEKQAEPFRAVLSEEKKAEIYQNIMEKIQEDEKTSSAADPLPEKKAAGAEELSSSRKTASRKSFWRQPLKLTGVLAAAVVDLMTQPELLEKAREEFAKRTAEGYTCPIPADAVPVVPD